MLWGLLFMKILEVNALKKLVRLQRSEIISGTESPCSQSLFGVSDKQLLDKILDNWVEGFREFNPQLLDLFVDVKFGLAIEGEFAGV